MYVQKSANTICTHVSNHLPFHSFEEYPTNWITRRAVQNIPSPNDIRFPNGVVINSWAEVIHSKPMSNTIKAIKKECTTIICRFTKLSLVSSCFQLKYLGKIRWLKANTMNKQPMILK